jgi:hypothetical protein
VGHPLGSPRAAHAHVHNRRPVPLLPRYADSSFLIAPYAVHQPISCSCIQALPHSNFAMLTVLFLQAWQAPYAVHQRIAGLCVLQKSLSNMKVHRYDIDFFFSSFKNSECRFCLMLCLKFWVYDMCLITHPSSGTDEVTSQICIAHQFQRIAISTNQVTV